MHTLIAPTDARLAHTRMTFYRAHRARTHLQYLDLLLQALHPNDFAAIAQLRTHQHRARRDLARATSAVVHSQTITRTRLHLNADLPWAQLMRHWAHQLVIHRPGEEPTMATTDLTPEQFRDDARLILTTDQVQDLPILEQGWSGADLVWEEYLDPHTAVRLWFYADMTPNGLPYTHTAMIERREIDPTTATPRWAVTRIYDTDDPTRTTNPAQVNTYI